MFFIGACVGSFLNVVLLRTHAHESFCHGRSKCTNCKSAIRVFDLVPMLSYLFLRGKCRSCKSKIDVQYPCVEFATGVLFFLTFLHADGSILLLLRDLGVICFLVLIFVYDLRYFIIPDKFVIPGILFVFLANLLFQIISVSSMLVAALVLGGFFLLQFLISRGAWVGGGDVRMAVFMGTLLGIQNGLMALFLAYTVGAMVGVCLIAFKKVDRKTAIPFGTFLSVATVAALFYGPELVKWYTTLLLG